MRERRLQKRTHVKGLDDDGLGEAPGEVVDDSLQRGRHRREPVAMGGPRPHESTHTPCVHDGIDLLLVLGLLALA
eukprot:4421225-Lingulodinium_polyedra.AAC.1